MGMEKKAMEKHKNRKLNRIVLLTVCALIAAASFAAVRSFAAPETQNRDSVEPAQQTANSGVEGGAFEVKEYDLYAKVGKDHSYAVKEQITVNIPDDLQSIEFAVPSGNFSLSDLKVEDTEYTARKASEASTVTITEPDKLSSGDHTYTIRYRISEYKDGDHSKDIFYFNVLLPEWKQPIGAVKIKAEFPDDFPWDDMQCYAGQFGVQDSTNKIRFKADEAAHTVTVTGKLIPENYGITLKAQLPDGYWQGELDGSWAVTAVIAAMAAAVTLLLILWAIGGRDPKVKRERVTKPLEGLTPVELGYIFRSRVSIRDVTLMLLDFACKGYLRISEYEPKRYRLIKIKDPTGEEKMFRNAFDILFEDIFTGRALEMEKIGERLERIMTGISDDVAAGFASDEGAAFTPLSRTFRYAGAVILGAAVGLSDAFSYCFNYQPVNYVESILTAVLTAGASLLLCRIIDNRDSRTVVSGRYTVAAGALLLLAPVAFTAFRVFSNMRSLLLPAIIVIASALAAFFIVIMRARGKENAVLVGRLRSLRNFIYHPEARAILQNYLDDPDYYYNMMIYALAFGGEESWAISFLTLDVPEPEWYSDDIEGHAYSNLRAETTTIDYARDLRSFVRTITTAYSGMQRNDGRRK